MNLETLDCVITSYSIHYTKLYDKNAPCYAGIGLGGEGHTSFTIAGPTGEGLTSARTFTRQRRCVLAESFRII